MAGNRIDQFFSAPAARNDRWREVNAAARAWASGRGDRTAVEAALAEGAAVEEFHAYPGVALLAALREKLGQGDAVGFASLARRISAAIASRSYQEDAGDWEPSDDTADAPSDRLPPTMGSQRARPYFEMLVVSPLPMPRWQHMVSQFRKVRRPEDPLIYEVVPVGSLEAAIGAILLNADIAAVTIHEGFGIESRHDAPVLRSVLAARAPALAEADEHDLSLRLANALKDNRPELDIYLLSDRAVEKLAGDPRSANVRRVMYQVEEPLELHLSILEGIQARYETPFFDNLKKYAQRPISTFHALPVARGKSVFKSGWIRDMGEFYGLNLFLAESSATTGGLDSLLEPPGTMAEQVSAMIALSYGITYIWGTVGIVLIVKYLPNWRGVDDRAAARAYEKEFGVASGDTPQLSGWTAGGLRAYRLENAEWQGRTIADLLRANPEYRVVNLIRDRVALGVPHDEPLKLGDVIALGGRREAMTEKMGLIGPEVSYRVALDVPLDRAEVLITNKDMLKREPADWRKLPGADQIQAVALERGGVPVPIGSNTKLQRMDIVTIVGLKDAVSQMGNAFVRIVRPSTATDLLTLSFGMILGFLIGAIDFPAFGARVGLGNAGGLLVSGVIVSSVVSRLRFFGNTPNAARNVLEDLGLVVFVAIVGINAGNSLLQQLTGLLALKIFVVGFVACSIPPVIVWAIGFHIFRINPAVLMGGVAGARSHSGPCREAAVEIQSNVPWIGFPVGYAVSGVLLTVFGYFAMLLAQ